MSDKSASEAIAQTGFIVSVISYAVFWSTDAFRLGFVARYLSVHVFLLSALVFGVWWASAAEHWRERRLLVYGAGSVLGILLTGTVWTAGEGLAEYRLLLAAIAAFVPLICIRLILPTDAD
jgi:hypothetical protein